MCGMAPPFRAEANFFLGYARLFRLARKMWGRRRVRRAQRNGRSPERSVSSRKGIAIPHIGRQSRKTSPEKITGRNIFGQDVLVNPLVIVELASPTTKGSENGERFIAYQSIASFQEYLLVAQDSPHVTRYVRQADNQWVRSDFIGLESSVELKSLAVTLSLGEIYQAVNFPLPNTPCAV